MHSQLNEREKMKHTRKNKKQKKLPAQISEQSAIRKKSEFEQAMNRIGIFKITEGKHK